MLVPPRPACDHIVAALNRVDPDHARARQALECEREPLIVPAGILAEAGYLIEADLGATVLRQFVADLADGFYELDCGEGDFAGSCRRIVPASA